MHHGGSPTCPARAADRARRRPLPGAGDRHGAAADRARRDPSSGRRRRGADLPWTPRPRAFHGASRRVHVGRARGGVPGVGHERRAVRLGRRGRRRGRRTRVRARARRADRPRGDEGGGARRNPPTRARRLGRTGRRDRVWSARGSRLHHDGEHPLPHPGRPPGRLGRARPRALGASGARRVHARRVHRNGGSRSGLDPRAAAAAGTVAVGTRGGARRGHPPSTCSGTPSPPARSPRRSAIPPVPEGPAAMRRSRRRSS